MVQARDRSELHPKLLFQHCLLLLHGHLQILQKTRSFCGPVMVLCITFTTLRILGRIFKKALKNI
jgi:hypothetical protein